MAKKVTKNSVIENNKGIKIGDMLYDDNNKPLIKGCKYINGKYYYTDNNGKVNIIV